MNKLLSVFYHVSSLARWNSSGTTMKIRLFCPHCVILPFLFFPLHQENLAIHFLYQVKLLRFIYLFICLFSIFFFFSFNKELKIR